jgi:hypothetical protein
MIDGAGAREDDDGVVSPSFRWPAILLILGLSLSVNFQGPYFMHGHNRKSELSLVQLVMDRLSGVRMPELWIVSMGTLNYGLFMLRLVGLLMYYVAIRTDLDMH